MIDAFAKALTDPASRLPDDIINIGGRFETYRSNYLSRLITVLTDMFPVAAKLVGPEFFEALVLEYANRFPPSSPFLGQYGENFADFLEDFEPIEQVPYLPDVARLEWARSEAISLTAAAPRQIFSEEDILRALHVPVRLSTTATLLRSSHPVGTIWAHHQSEPPEPVTDWRGETVAVWQVDGEIRQVIVPDQELVSFIDMEKGAPFMSRLQEFDDEGQVAAMIGAFVNYLNLGFLSLCDPANGELTE